MQRHDYHQEDMSLFVPAPSDTSAVSREWIEFRPVNQVTNTSVLDFNIPAQTSSYVDLMKSVLNVKVKLVKGDNSDPDGEVLGPVNLTLHSIFRQADVTFQQTPLAHTGVNYPYKAYIDTILNTSENEQKGILTSQFFYKDTGDVDTNDAKTGNNEGLKTRYVKTQNGKIIDMEGPLRLDMFQQPKLLVNGWPSVSNYGRIMILSES